MVDSVRMRPSDFESQDEGSSRDDDREIVLRGIRRRRSGRHVISQSQYSTSRQKIAYGSSGEKKQPSRPPEAAAGSPLLLDACNRSQLGGEIRWRFAVRGRHRDPPCVLILGTRPAPVWLVGVSVSARSCFSGVCAGNPEVTQAEEQCARQAKAPSHNLLRRPSAQPDFLLRCFRNARHLPFAALARSRHLAVFRAAAAITLIHARLIGIRRPCAAPCRPSRRRLPEDMPMARAAAVGGELLSSIK